MCLENLLETNTLDYLTTVPVTMKKLKINRFFDINNGFFLSADAKSNGVVSY